MRTYLILAVLIVASVAAEARKPETGFLNREVSVNGTSYRYVVYVPAEWNKKQKWPVILFLHGAGERGTDGLIQSQVGLPTAIRREAARWPFIVVMPQCRENKWWTDADMGVQALAALDASMKEFKGDPERVYLSGLSMGGYGTWALSSRNPKRFAALVPICGGVLPPKGYQQAPVAEVADPYSAIADKIKHLPVWIFHGDADPVVPVDESRKMAAALKAAGAEVTYTEYPGVSHNSWDKAYAEKELPGWLLSKRRK